MRRDDALTHRLSALAPIGLDELDQRASLQQRTDTKYVLDDDAFAKLLNELEGDHVALETDGSRSFGYESVYFDTPDLRCFHDHISGAVPRFKARTRLYRDTGQCSFEVKLKVGRGETDKRQVDHPADGNDRLDGAAIECLNTALDRVQLTPPEHPLAPSLRTTFTRLTLASARGRERTTCDLLLELERPGAARRGQDGRSARARIRERLMIVETKSERGDGAADRALRALHVEPTSFSKYRTGIALLAAEVRDPEALAIGERLFTVENPAPSGEKLSSL